MKKKELFSRLYYHQLNRLLYEFKLVKELENPGDKGREVEEILRGFLKEIFPQKWGISTGYAITDDNISSQIDIMIYDKNNFPRVYCGYLLEVIPIMALHLAIEVKMRLNTTNLDDANKKSSKLKNQYFGDMYIQMAKQNLDEKQFYTSLFAFESDCNLKSIQKRLSEKKVNGLDLILILDQGMIIKDGETYATISKNDMAWTGFAYDGFEVTKRHKLMVMYITYILNRMKANSIVDTDYQTWHMRDSIREDVFED